MGAWLGGPDGGADLLDQRPLALHLSHLEVAQDEVQLGRRRRAAHGVEVDEPLAAFGRLRRQRHLGHGIDDLGRQVQRVDQLVLGPAGVDRHTLDTDDGPVGRERLVDQFAAMRAVERVAELGPQVVRQIGVDAVADLLVGRKADADGAVGDFGMLQQIAGGGHNDGHARFVVGPQQRGAAGGHDVVADAILQVGRVLIGENLFRVVGQGNGAALIVAVDDGLDARATEGRTGVHVGQQGDGRHVLGHGGRNGRQNRAILGQAHVLRANLFQFVNEQVQQVVLPLRAGRSGRGFVGRGVDLDVAYQALLDLAFEIHGHDCLIVM